MPIVLVALFKHFCLHILFITPFQSETRTCDSSGVPCSYYGLTKQQHIVAYGTSKATNVRLWTNTKHPPHTGQPWIIF